MSVGPQRRIPTGRRYRYPSRGAQNLVAGLFATSIHRGRVGLQFADEIVEVGSGDYICTIAPPTLPRFLAMLAKPDFRLPSYFTQGFWCCEPKRLHDFLELLTTQERSPLNGWYRFLSKNPIRDKIIYRLFPLRVKQNIADHYNTSPDFMKLILGDGLEYTCAFFDENHIALAEAQENKIERVISRLGIEPRHNVLDLGCGWGQLAEAVTQKTGARVTGINLSSEQIGYADKHRSSERLAFFLTDYEAFRPANSFDRIYSVGMLEHVGLGLLDRYFAKIFDLLARDGLALVHCIVRRHHKSTNNWIDQEVFPGAYIPQLSEIIRHIERSGLELVQIYTHDRTNYSRTLNAWLENFYRNEQALEDVLSRLVKSEEAEEIMRLWEFYLCGSRLAFNGKNGDCSNVQIVLRKSNKMTGDRADKRTK